MGCSLFARCGLLTAVAPLLRSMGSKQPGFSGRSTRAQRLWAAGLVAPWCVGSFWTRDQTHVPCTGRWIPNHRTTREVLKTFKEKFLFPSWSFFLFKGTLSAWCVPCSSMFHAFITYPLTLTRSFIISKALRGWLQALRGGREFSTYN